MTQTLDVGEGFTHLDSSPATGAPTSTQTRAKSGAFAITFGIAFPLLYTIYERLNWPLFTYHPVLGNLDFGRQPTGVGPPMFWYGWIVLAAASAFVVAGIATIIPTRWLRRATVFCCALAALWPARRLPELGVGGGDSSVRRRSNHYLLRPRPIGGTRVDKLVADRADRRTRRPRLLTPPAVVSAVGQPRRRNGPVRDVSARCEGAGVTLRRGARAGESDATSPRVRPQLGLLWGHRISLPHTPTV